MGIEKIENLSIPGPNGKPLVLDVYHKNLPGDLVIFCHGYKENKHWGAWDLLAERFASLGYVFVKFNYSFNGTSPADLSEFSDLEAFAQNRFSYELDDTLVLIDYLRTKADFKALYTENSTHLIGHSRGGSMSILAEEASKHSIETVSAWAAPASFEYFLPKGWKKWYWALRKRVYLKHPRTGLKLPHDYSFYKDYFLNQQRLNLIHALHKSKARHLFMQGTNDGVVSVSQAEELHGNSKDSKLIIVDQMDHNLGNKTPWTGEGLPGYLQICVEDTLKFIKNEG
ncbi:MAG: alpha/beta hydrolase family protein [Flavobacteriaceae bacterium]